MGVHASSGTAVVGKLFGETHETRIEKPDHDEPHHGYASAPSTALGARRV
jgi:hypothetical protein